MRSPWPGRMRRSGMRWTNWSDADLSGGIYLSYHGCTVPVIFVAFYYYVHVPLAFTGGFFALFVTDNEVGVVSMIGFVMLAGVIVNNGIVLVDYINQLRREGMDKKEAIVTAGRTRLRPILMTALTTILAMSTMAMGLGSGSEICSRWRSWLREVCYMEHCWHWSWCLVSMICLRGTRVWWRKRSKKTVDKPRVPSYDKNSKKQRLWERGVHINSLQRGKFTGWKTSQRKICGR